MKLSFMYKVILLWIIIIGVSYANITREPFTSGIRKLYRPHVRNARIMAEGFHEKYSQRTSNFLRRVGII